MDKKLTEKQEKFYKSVCDSYKGTGIAAPTGLIHTKALELTDEDVDMYFEDVRNEIELQITDLRVLKMYKTPVTGKECISYGWKNDSMGEVFDETGMYEAVLNEGNNEIIIVPVKAN